MEVENSVVTSKDAKHQLDLQKRREAYRTKRDAETTVEKTNRLASEANKRKLKLSRSVNKLNTAALKHLGVKG